jgi:hypothetical protein
LALGEARRGTNFHASVFSSTRGAYAMPSRVAHRFTWKCSGTMPVSWIATSVARCRYASRRASSTVCSASSVSASTLEFE